MGNGLTRWPVLPHEQAECSRPLPAVAAADPQSLCNHMNIQSEVTNILIDDSLDDECRQEGKCDLIEALIPKHGWETVQAEMIDVLEDYNRRQKDYLVVAEVFWGAALDKRKIQVDRVIALLYYRLKPDTGSTENNLAWSIVCRLKDVDYLSEYDPLEDAAIRAELQRIRKA